MTTTEPQIRCYASAGGIVVDAKTNQVLVLLRPNRQTADGRAEIRLPKGHIEPGEDRIAAALREVQEESGLEGMDVVADLGHQMVEFDAQNRHTLRDESAFLMLWPDGAPSGPPETQFQPLWLSWEEAQRQISFESEREWLRRAERAWQALARPGGPAREDGLGKGNG